MMGNNESESWKEVDRHSQLSLYRAYQRGDEGSQEAHAQLIRSLLGIAQKLGNWYARRYGVDAEDLIQDGIVGMLPAINSYDDTRGSKLSTYVHPFVLRAVSKKARSYANNKRELVLSGGVGSSVGNTRTELTQEEAAEVRKVIQQVLDRVLSPMESKVVRMAIGLANAGKPMQHAEIAKALKKSRSRISQIWGMAKRKLMTDKQFMEIARELGYDVVTL